jgi:pyruvate,water dikinase
VAGDVIIGWGASGGRHTGPARVLTAPQVSLVEIGDVVVARRTDASWLPVFLRAGAVVVEEGGPLSHASIVARELDLPAVVNAAGAVDRLRGERWPVTVDGDSGVVTICTDVAGESPSSPAVGTPADAPGGGAGSVRERRERRAVR